MTTESEADVATRPVHPQTGDFPTIPDQFDPAYKDTGDDEKTNIHDFGLNEEVEVGHKGSVHSYGIAE